MNQEKIEEEIAKKLQGAPRNNELKGVITQEVSNADYLKEDWQKEYAVNRILELILKKESAEQTRIVVLGGDKANGILLVTNASLFTLLALFTLPIISQGGPSIGLFTIFSGLCAFSWWKGVQLLRRVKTVSTSEADFRSGLGSMSHFPDELKCINWGAFFFNVLWGISHSVWISLVCLIPGVGFFFAFYLGGNGNELAWRKNTWRSVGEFNKYQRRWAYCGLAYLVLMILGGIVVGLMTPSA